MLNHQSSVKLNPQKNKSPITLAKRKAKTFEYIKKRGPKAFDYNIEIEINNDLTPKTWTDKEI